MLKLMQPRSNLYYADVRNADDAIITRTIKVAKRASANAS